MGLNVEIRLSGHDCQNQVDLSCQKDSIRSANGFKPAHFLIFCIRCRNLSANKKPLSPDKTFLLPDKMILSGIKTVLSAGKGTVSGG